MEIECQDEPLIRISLRIVLYFCKYRLRKELLVYLIWMRNFKVNEKSKSHHKKRLNHTKQINKTSRCDPPNRRKCSERSFVVVYMYIN